MDLSTAANNVNSSIDAYRKYSTWIPNMDSRDNFLKNALKSDSLSWAGLGAIAGSRAPRMAYLQNGVSGLSTPFETTTTMQFDVGTTGWWFNYAMDPTDGKNGWLFVIIRTPTVGVSQNPVDGMTDTAIYSIGGYVVADGVRYPITEDGNPLTCSGSYTTTTNDDGSERYELQITPDPSDGKIKVSNLEFFADQSGVFYWNLDFKTGDRATGDLTAKYKAVPHGSDNACAPCVDGVGTNYWSWTYMQGTFEYIPQNGDSPFDKKVIGWFDHQWGTLSVVPRSWWAQMMAALNGYFSKPASLKWIWVTVVLAENLQYSCSVTIPDGKTLEKDAVFTSNVGIKYAYDDDGNVDITYDLPISLKINSMLDTDTSISGDVTVTIDDTQYIVRGMVDNGFVTLFNGSLNEEVPSIVYDADNNPIGVGFLEMNNIHTTEDNVKNTLRVMGMDASQANVDALTPKAYSFSQVWAILALLMLTVLIIIVLLVLVVWGIVKLIKLL